jgi:hypothetical protein
MVKRMTNKLWGNGNCRLVYGGMDVIFSYDNANLRFSKESDKRFDENGDLVERFYGFRAILEANLYNYNTGDSAKFQTMIGILNASENDNAGILVYPNYNVLDEQSNISFTMRLDSDIAPSQLAENIFAGESVQIKFQSVSRQLAMPTNVANDEITYRCYDSSDITSLRVYNSADSTTRRKNR